MVQIFKAKKSNKKSGKNKQQYSTLRIDGIDHQGRGICRQHKPVVFVEGALPGELCKVKIEEEKSRFWTGRATKLLESSIQRIKPFCSHYESCGGCHNQHLKPVDLIKHKQDAISELLVRVGGMETINWCPPIIGDERAYRRKARLAVDGQHGKSVAVGFRGKGSKQVIDITECQVLTLSLQAIISPLNELLKQLHNIKPVGHINLIEDDEAVLITVRVIQPLNNKDSALFTEFSQRHHCRVMFEVKSNEFTSEQGNACHSHYSLSDNIKIGFNANDFIQVNGPLNKKMVAQALDWLQLKKTDHVLDLFCGVGNFSLPMALQCASVLGIEGIDEMVERASINATDNGIVNAQFMQKNLDDATCFDHQSITQCNKVLLDPARAGAKEVVTHMGSLDPQAVLYISCNPATFARDAEILIKQGYKLEKIALMDMFPYTSHTEMMALFKPQGV